MFSILVMIFILGLLFGSLSTVLVERWHSGKWGILMWRSECPKCLHTLSARELIPLFSYLFQQGSCRHCKSQISLLYPFSEIFMGCVFVIMSFIAWRFDIELFSMSHILLLSLGFITWVYMLYDIRYMEIPDQIMVPSILGYIGLLISSFYFTGMEYILFDGFAYKWTPWELVSDHIIWAWILYTFLYIQILIPGGWYLAKRGRMRDLLELIASYILFPFMLIYSYFLEERSSTESEPIPTWVGGGDLRIAIFIGLTLGVVHGIASFVFAYIIGSIVGIVYLIRKSYTPWMSSEIPFWPFLGMGWFLSMIFHSEIIRYVEQFSPYF